MSHMNRTKVFISYAHEDKEWVSRLKVHLKPLERAGILDRWDDTKIDAGTQWRNEIRAAIYSAKIAILFLSADFLASDFIAKDELPPLLDAAEEDGLIIIPVVVKPCRFEETPEISRYQAINSPDKSVIGMSETEREQLWVKLSKRIEATLKDAIQSLRYKEGSRSVPGGIDWPYMHIDKVTSGIVIDLATKMSGHRWIGELVVSAMEKVGRNGIIIVEEGCGTECALSVVEGTHIKDGFLSPYFINNERRANCELKDVMILVHSKVITHSEDLYSILHSMKEINKSLMFIGEGFDEKALETLVNFTTEKSFDSVAVKNSGFSENSREDVLQDLAILTGGEVNHILSKHIVSKCGTAKRVISTQSGTTIIDTGFSFDALRGRVKQLRHGIEEVTSQSQKEILEKRLVMLIGGVAIIKVGASTISELKERTVQIEKVVSELQEWLSLCAMYGSDKNDS